MWHMRVRFIVAAGLVVVAGVVAGLFATVIPTASANSPLLLREVMAKNIPPVHYIAGTYGAYAGKCVDVPGGHPVDGAQLQIWTATRPRRRPDLRSDGAGDGVRHVHGCGLGFHRQRGEVQLARCYPNDPPSSGHHSRR